MPGKRSRGELVLDALDFVDASDAVEMLTALDTKAYRPFNMVIADNTHAFWLRNAGDEVEAFPLAEGVTMITASDANDPKSKRIRHFLPLWQAAEAPDPDKDEWSEWQELLASREHAPDGDALRRDEHHFQHGIRHVVVFHHCAARRAMGDAQAIWRFHTGRTADWHTIPL